MLKQTSSTLKSRARAAQAQVAYPFAAQKTTVRFTKPAGAVISLYCALIPAQTTLCV